MSNDRVRSLCCALLSIIITFVTQHWPETTETTPSHRNLSLRPAKLSQTVKLKIITHNPDWLTDTGDGDLQSEETNFTTVLWVVGTLLHHFSKHKISQSEIFLLSNPGHSSFQSTSFIWTQNSTLNFFIWKQPMLKSAFTVTTLVGWKYEYWVETWQLYSFLTNNARQYYELL